MVKLSDLLVDKITAWTGQGLASLFFMTSSITYSLVTLTIDIIFTANGNSKHK